MFNLVDIINASTCIYPRIELQSLLVSCQVFYKHLGPGWCLIDLVLPPNPGIQGLVLGLELLQAHLKQQASNFHYRDIYYLYIEGKYIFFTNPTQHLEWKAWFLGVYFLKGEKWFLLENQSILGKYHLEYKKKDFFKYLFFKFKF